MKLDAASFIGQTFNGMYKIVRPIGTGGMGAVFEATHTRLQNKRYAVKMLHASIAQDAEVFQRFRREAEIATELGHPHIVEVHDFNITPEGAPYMVMEFLDGEDLAGRLAKRGPLTVDVMARIVAEVCSGLDAAHNAGIVHRDLKPQNIFLCRRLGRDDFVKIVDFGVSKVRDSASVVTRDHTLMGTPFYMSPEQADGLVQQIDSRTDIFAMGAIMWEMLVGRMAFEAPTISGAMYKVVHVDPPEVHTLRPDVPPAVSLVLRRAMAKEKELRYASVVELSHDFANALRGIPPAVRPPPLRLVPQTMGPANVPPTAHGRLATPRPNGGAPHGDVAMAPTGYATPVPGMPAPDSVAGVSVVPAGAPVMPAQAAPFASMPAVPLSTTMSTASGQMIPTPAPIPPDAPVASMGAPSKKKGVVIGLVAGLLVLGGAAAIIVPRLGGSSEGRERHAGGRPGPEGDPGKPDRPDKPDRPEIVPDRPAPSPAVVADLTLTGHVHDRPGKPVAGAIVTLETTPPRETTTRADGWFGFDKLAPGRYEVRARDASGKHSTQFHTEVAAPKGNYVEIVLADLEAPTAPPPAEEVTLTIDVVNVKGASITVDGRPLDGNQVKVPKGKTVAIAIKAGGYLSWEKKITATGDDTITVRLATRPTTTRCDPFDPTCKRKR